jgi:hypothetical protein
LCSSFDVDVNPTDVKRRGDRRVKPGQALGARSLIGFPFSPVSCNPFTIIIRTLPQVAIDSRFPLVVPELALGLRYLQCYCYCFCRVLNALMMGFGDRTRDLCSTHCSRASLLETIV